jgi:hypothetical protein
LVGDTDQIKAAMGELVNLTKQTADAVKGNAQIMENALKLAGAVGGLATLKDFLAAFSEEENALIDLNAVLIANGRSVDSTMERYQEFASTMEEVTTYADEATIALLKQAESFNLTGDAAEKAVKDAMAFASINNSSAEAMIRVTAAMAEGDVERAMMFSRMIPQLRGVKDEAQFLEKYAKLAAAGMDSLEAKAQTASGSMTRLSNAFSNFKEQLGKIIADAIKPVIDILITLSKWLQTLPDWIKQALVAITAISAALLAFAGLKSIILAAGAVIIGVIKSIFSVAITNPWLLAIGAVIVTLLALRDAFRDVSAAASAAGAAAATSSYTTGARGGTEAIIRSARESSTPRSSLEAALREAEESRAAVLRRGARDIMTASARGGVADLGAIRTAATEWDRRVRDIRDAIAGITPAADRAVSEFVRKLNDEAAVIGLSAEQIERRKLALRGASEAALAELDIAIERNAELKKQIELYKGVETFVHSMREELVSFASLGGGREGTIDRLIFGAEGRLGVINRLEAMRPLAHMIDLIEKAKSVYGEVLTPAERIADRQAELKEMFDAGTISLEVYTRAMKAAANQANEFAAAQDAVAAGSAAGLARVRAYRDLLSGSPISGTTLSARSFRDDTKPLLTRIAESLERMERRTTGTAITGTAGFLGGL